MPNREHRRAAEKQGVDLPVLEVRLFGNGQVVIDKHGDMTLEQVEGFLQQMIVKVQMDQLTQGPNRDS